MVININMHSQWDSQVAKTYMKKFPLPFSMRYKSKY